MYAEDQLIRDVIKGEKKAINHLISEYQNYIYTICIGVLKTKQEAEEATQDSFLKIIRALPDYIKKGKLTTWMYSVAYRTSLDYLKKRKSTTEINGFDQGVPNQIEEKLQTEERNQSLLDLIDKLNPEDAGLIRMYYLEEMSIKEVAALTDMSESNIKIKLFRSRKLLGELAKKQNTFSEYINS